MARAKTRAVAGTTCRSIAPSRRCRCQSSGRVISIRSGDRGTAPSGVRLMPQSTHPNRVGHDGVGEDLPAVDGRERARSSRPHGARSLGPRRLGLRRGCAEDLRDAFFPVLLDRDRARLQPLEERVRWNGATEEITLQLIAPSITKEERLSRRLDAFGDHTQPQTCLLYTSPSPRDATLSRMPSSA